MLRTRLRPAVLALFSLIVAVPALAQISARGRIYLPNGQPMMEVMEVELRSEDSRRPSEFLFTDSKGWFFLRGLRANSRYTIVVQGDGKAFNTTSEEFFASPHVVVYVHLKPFVQVKEESVAHGVSVQQLQHEPPPKARKAYEDAVAALREQRYDVARAKFQEAINADPLYVSAYNELAAVEIAERHYPEAETLLRKAVEIDPGAPHALSNLGLALNYQGRHADALEPLRKALQLRPRWVAPKVFLGIALLETGDVTSAEGYLQQGTSASGLEEAMAYLYLGKLHVIKGEREKAIAAWENYLRRDPDSMNAVNVREMLLRLRAAGSGQ